MYYNYNTDKNGCLEVFLGFFLAIAFIVGWACIFALPFMWLWNWLMPAIFGLKTITWLQALGLNFLTGILFRKSVTINKND